MSLKTRWLIQRCYCCYLERKFRLFLARTQLGDDRHRLLIRRYRDKREVSAERLILVGGFSTNFKKGVMFFAPYDGERAGSY